MQVILHIASDAKKTLKRRKNEKQKSIRKDLQRSNANKILYFYFCIWKMIYFARKYSLGKCSLYYYISSKDVWNEVMKHQRPYRPALVL